MQGGAVADGTYVLSSVTYYGLCQETLTIQATWQICGDVWNFAENATEADASGALHANYMSTREGSTIVANPICSSGAALSGAQYDFTATPSRLTLAMSSNGSVVVGVYELQ
jgi:hypothetical protein